MPQSGTLSAGWYYRLLGEEFGPVSRDLLDRLIAEGQLGASDEVRDGEAGAWHAVSQLAISASAPTAHNGRAMEGTSFSLESLSGAGLEELEAATESPAKATSAPMEQWFYQNFGQEWGPFDFEELLEHARQGDLGADDMIRLGSTGKWRRAGSMGRLAAVMPYSVREAKTIPLGKKSGDSDDDLEIRVPVKSPPAEIQQAAPPPAVAPSPPPPPPPPPPMMPVAGYGAYPSPYAPPPVAPGWGYGQPAAPVNDLGWYAWLGGVECGPMDYNQFTNWAATGRITGQDYVKQGKYSQWIAAQTVPGLNFAPVAPPLPPRPVVAPTPAPVAAATATPPARPSVQLPPPPKAAAPAPSPSPSPRETSPSGPSTDTRPESRPEPPPRSPGGDWGSSSVMSTYRPGMNLNPTASKKPAPSKSKKKSSGGGDFDVGALFKDVRVLGGLGVVLLGVGIYFGIGLLPEGTGPLKAAHKDITALHKEVMGMADNMPKGDDQKAYLKKLKEKTGKIKKGYANSKLPAKSSLSSAISAIESAAGKPTAKEVNEKLADAEKKLKDAAKKLGM